MQKPANKMYIFLETDKACLKEEMAASRPRVQVTRLFLRDALQVQFECDGDGPKRKTESAV